MVSRSNFDIKIEYIEQWVLNYRTAGKAVWRALMGQIEDLRLFASVIENRSISGAANDLHIAKSAVSRRLGLLEERYGARLIAREPGNWEITATGLELYHRAIRVVSDVDEIEHDFTSAVQDLAGPLTVSVPREFGMAYLNASIIEFTQLYPEIQLTVDFDDRTVDMTRENYDLAVRITPSLNDELVAVKIGTTRHQLCASPSYLAKNGIPETAKDLLDHQLLNFGSAKRVVWEFKRKNGRAERIEFQPALNSNNGLFLLSAAEKGVGIAALPNFLSDRAIASGTIVSMLPELDGPQWGIFIIHSEGRRLNRRMRLFIDHLQSTGSQAL